MSFLTVHAGINEWHGVGIIAALLGIALLAWEGARLLGARIEFGPVTPGLGSVGIALLLLLFTVITFLSHSDARHWPAWVGLLLSIAIAGAALRRARTEGVQVPDLNAIKSEMSGRVKTDTGGQATPAAQPQGDAESEPTQPSGAPQTDT
ncbi:MAG TPA: hypothetical protein VF327_09730 [Gaiellaceae bacterium]